MCLYVCVLFHLLTIFVHCDSMRRAIHLFGTALRETGQKLDRFALEATSSEIYKETFSRHRSVMNLFDRVSQNFSTLLFLHHHIFLFSKVPVLAAGTFV